LPQSRRTPRGREPWPRITGVSRASCASLRNTNSKPEKSTLSSPPPLSNLGIDIGSVDLVCQIGSPRSISVGLQRIGRAGHWRGANPERPLLRHDARTISSKTPRSFAPSARATWTASPFRILRWTSSPSNRSHVRRRRLDGRRFFQSVRRAYPYRNLERKSFDEIVEMLSEGIASQRGRYGAYLHRDRASTKFCAAAERAARCHHQWRRDPENSLYSVVAQPEGVTVGTVDEDFAVESLAGDIILLGNTSWRIRRVTSGSVLVEDAQGAAPTVPFWRGEAPARTDELSAHVAELREQISSLARVLYPPRISTNPADFIEAVNWLKAECGLDQSGAEQAANTSPRTRGPRRHSNSKDRHRRALLRRKAAACSSSSTLPLARASTRPGIGAAQAFLPLLQFRAASRRHRQRPEHLPQRATQLSTRRRLPLPPSQFRAARSRTGRAAFSTLHHSLALGCRPLARASAFSRRKESPAQHSAHARG